MLDGEGQGEFFSSCHCERSVAISIASTEIASADFASLAMTKKEDSSQLKSKG
jgi:hypothetical protein